MTEAGVSRMAGRTSVRADVINDAVRLVGFWVWATGLTLAGLLCVAVLARALR